MFHIQHIERTDFSKKKKNHIPFKNKLSNLKISVDCKKMNYNNSFKAFSSPFPERSIAINLPDLSIKKEVGIA